MKKWDKREKYYNKFMWLSEFLNMGKFFTSPKRIHRILAHMIFFMGIFHIAMVSMYYLDWLMWNIYVSGGCYPLC